MNNIQNHGILSDQQIEALFDTNLVTSSGPLDDDQIQPASLDLRLGQTAYRVRASFLPGTDTRVEDKLDRFCLHKFDLTKGAVLETGCVYIVPLQEQLALREGLEAAANPKSSTGRLDIFTRVITDNGTEFDKIPSEYSGPLYLEISPRTFPIVVRTGSRLAQIRFRNQGKPLNDQQLAQLHQNYPLVVTSKPNITHGGIAVSVDLKGAEDGIVGYRGKRHTGVIDVDQKAQASIDQYWEPIYRNQAGELVLDPNEFYILASREAVQVPPSHAAEMTPFDPLVGEFRVHYAGFFDPGFGHAAAAGTGSRAVLEVRSHDVPFILEHGQIVGRLVYEAMSQMPNALYGSDRGSNYQAQGLKLSKHFR